MNILKTISQIRKVSHILPMLMVLVTGESRYLPEMRWSSNSWTRNIFNVYELLFWRRYGKNCGIVYESSKYTRGDEPSVQVAHTFKAQLSLLEQWVRNLDTARIVLERQPQFSLASPLGGQSIPLKNYLFAVSFVRATTTDQDNGGGSVTQSYAFDASSGDFMTVYSGTTSNYTYVSTTYHASLTTNIINHTIGTFPRIVQANVLHAPASGSNTLLITYTGTPGAVSIESLVGLYSGVIQADSVDNSTVSDIAGSGSQTISLTTSVTGDWLSCCTYDGLAKATATVNGTLRNTGDAFGTVDMYFEDSNGSVGAAGSYTIGWNQNATSARCAFMGLALSPVASVAHGKMFLVMG